MDRRTVLVALAATITGCGGGGGGTEPPAPVPLSALPPTGISVWGDSLSIGLQEQMALLYPAREIYQGAIGGNTSTQIKDRYLPESSFPNNTTVIWAGRNNYQAKSTVLADIATIVAAMPHDRYLVLGVPNGDYSLEQIGQPNHLMIADLNAALAAAYGARYIDVLAILLAGGNGSPQDTADVARGVPPSSLRQDQIHLNAAGSALVAGAVKSKVDANGW